MQESQEVWVQSLGWEDSLEEEMAPHSSILAWKIPWTEEPSRLQSTGLQRIRHDSVGVHTHTHTLVYGVCNSTIYLKKIMSFN